MIYISNNQLTVTINEKGAELQSVQLNGLEYLWQADGKYWGKHSPIVSCSRRVKRWKIFF